MLPNDRGYSHYVAAKLECHFCPPNSKGRRPLLECSDQNYSGSGVDMANCPVCGKGFAIYYKVEIAKVEHEPSWDVNIE